MFPTALHARLLGQLVATSTTKQHPTDKPNQKTTSKNKPREGVVHTETRHNNN
jgi:hypothetical protein